MNASSKSTLESNLKRLAEKRLVLPGAALCLALAFPAAAQTLRCEDAAGKVTYVQGTCPPGTQPVRTLAEPPPPLPADRAAASARAHSEARESKRIDKERAAEEAHRAKAARAEEARARADARTCRRLELRLKQAGDDLKNATLKRQAQAERNLRKARDSYQLECKTP
jgi:hypothetical protein